MPRLARCQARRRAGATGAAAGASALTSSASRAQARIDDDVEHVDDEVDDDDAGREQHDDIAHDRQVAVGDRLEDEAAEPRQGEDVLDHHRAGEQVGELQPHHREHRHHGVAQHVAPEHASRRLALGARGAHEVLAQHVEHRRADDAREDRRLHDRQRHGRQHERAQAGPEATAVGRAPAREAAGREPAQLHREEPDEKDREPEVGQRDADLADGS